MLDTVARSETELPLDTVTKRERVEQELRSNSARSDRQIGRVCGVDGKTVATARERLGISKTREDLLIETLPPGIDPDSPAFMADLDKVDAITKREAAREALGMDEESGPKTHPFQAAPGSHAAKILGLDKDEDKFDWFTDDSVLLKRQPATAVYFNPAGDLVIRQEAEWNEEQDTFVFISKPYLMEFLDKLTDICGIPTLRG